MLFHTGTKPFACSECDYRAAQKGNLTVHMRTHSNEKPFACSVCDYRTARKGDLTVHMRTHSNEKPFGCEYCSHIDLLKEVTLLNTRKDAEKDHQLQTNRTMMLVFTILPYIV